MKKRFLGWAQSRATEHSTTCHAIVVAEGTDVAGAACDGRTRVAGQVHPNPPDYAPHICQRIGCYAYKNATVDRGEANVG